LQETWGIPITIVSFTADYEQPSAVISYMLVNCILVKSI